MFKMVSQYIYKYFILIEIIFFLNIIVQILEIALNLIT